MVLGRIIVVVVAPQFRLFAEAAARKNLNRNTTIIYMRKMPKLGILILVILSLTALTSVLVSTVTGCTKADFENAIESPTQTIYIQPDGNVIPETTPIQRDGDTYTFTDNIYDPIIVDKSSIVIDGAGYMLQGTYNGTQTDLWIIGLGSSENTDNGTQIPWTVGIDLRANTQDLTIKNLNIKNFSIGIWLWTPNNTITGNSITENLVGILLSECDNTINGNVISNNQEGIFFGANQPGNIPTNITLSRNSFADNNRHLSGCVCEDFNSNEATHTWDNGNTGNYWSDYNGTDSNGDGLGDTPYVIDVLNQDRYPLTHSVATFPTVAPKFPTELIVPVALLCIILVAAGLKHKKRISNNPKT